MKVIGSIMQDTLLLAQVDKYRLEPRDFEGKFQQIIFSSIFNMYLDGAKNVDIIDVSNYLNTNTELKAIFESKENNGIQFLQDCLEISDPVNFEPYYKTVKKFSALRALKADGFNTDLIYNPNRLDKNYNKLSDQFKEMSVSDIFNFYKKKLLTLEDSYVSTSNSGSIEAANGLKNLKEQLKKAPEIGLPTQGEIINSVTRGARKGKFYLRSAGTGVGKTRLAVGDACSLAFPIFYDTKTNSWINRGYSEKVLFITTELDFDEIQTLLMAFISGVNEDNILFGTYTMEEEERVDRAISIIEKYRDNFILDHIPDPSIGQIESSVRKNCLVNGVQNVFYDYIFSSPSLLNEFASLHIREDIVLGMLSTSLKDLGVELDVFMQSSTQLSGDLEAKKGIRDQRFLRGSKAIADKCDVGMISMELNGEELKIITTLCEREGFPIPTIVTDVYKARRSRYKNVKIWSRTDLGTCRSEDLFITDGYYNLIENFRFIDFKFLSDSGEIVEFGEDKKQEVVNDEIKPIVKPIPKLKSASIEETAVTAKELDSEIRNIRKEWLG